MSQLAVLPISVLSAPGALEPEYTRGWWADPGMLV